MRRVSSIICAYNEAVRIGKVLEAVSSHPDVDEIIVVDDGSTDDTAKIVSRYPNVLLVRHETNRGKTAAIMSGINRATGDLLFFMDADLVGVTALDIQRLIAPVRSGVADMTITLRKNSLLVYRILGCDFVSGERVFPRALIEGEEERIAALPPFGFEVFINRLALERKLRVKIVRWSSVVTPPKTSKRGIVPGLKADAGMIRDIFSVITPIELLEQNYYLAGLFH